MLVWQFFSLLSLLDNQLQKMKKLYFLAALISASLTFAQQAPPFYEGFSYTVGEGLQSQAGWISLNTGDDLTITEGSLTYSGIPGSSGNKIAFGGAGIDAAKEFAQQTGNTVYYSFLLNVTDLSAVTSTTGGYIAGFIQGTGTSYGATLWLKKVDETTYSIGINTRTTAANTVFATNNYTVGTTYLIVASYSMNSSTGDDVANLWVNPTLGGAQPAPTATGTNTGGTDLTNIQRFLIRQGSATDTPNVELDELRIATTWTDATQTTLALGTNQSAIPGFRVYPNPVTGGMLYIDADSSSDKAVSIFDVLGKQVIRTTTSQAINVSALQSGVYVVKVTVDGKSATRKLVIR
jgi:hypothetical protein